VITCVLVLIYIGFVLVFVVVLILILILPIFGFLFDFGGVVVCIYLWSCVGITVVQIMYLVFWCLSSHNEDIMEFWCKDEVPICTYFSKILKNLKRFLFFFGVSCAFLGDCDPMLLGQ